SQTRRASSGSVGGVFGTLLKQARLKAKMTQEDLAAKASLTREYVSLLERDKRTPTVEVFIRLVRAVGMSPAEVILEIEKALPT
ncbi:MAG TPA: helix-turn-helix transcriptional regulator, partial [Urbifossiella sp.]|nr:helix-turn-helix transcriptional regulator [Urbifossiella sp.]